MSNLRSGDERVGRTMLEVTATEQQQFDRVRQLLSDGGRIGEFNRVVLVRVMLEACAEMSAPELVAAFDRWTDRRFAPVQVA